MSPTLNGSSVIQRFERSDVIKIRNGIILDFYVGLPHMSHQSEQELAHLALIAA